MRGVYQRKFVVPVDERVIACTGCGRDFTRTQYQIETNKRQCHRCKGVGPVMLRERDRRGEDAGATLFPSLAHQVWR